MFFQSGCRLEEEAQVWGPGFSHLFAVRIKMRKKKQARKENQNFKCSSKDTVHVCLIWQQSPSERCSPSPNPSPPPATIFYLSVLLMQLSVGILFGGKKCVFKVWMVLQSLKWLHSNPRGCEIRHRAGCQRLRGARNCSICRSEPCCGPVLGIQPWVMTSPGLFAILGWKECFSAEVADSAVLHSGDRHRDDTKLHRLQQPQRGPVVRLQQQWQRHRWMPEISEFLPGQHMP